MFVKELQEKFEPVTPPVDIYEVRELLAIDVANIIGKNEFHNIEMNIGPIDDPNQEVITAIDLKFSLNADNDRSIIHRTINLIDAEVAKYDRELRRSNTKIQSGYVELNYGRF